MGYIFIVGLMDGGDNFLGEEVVMVRSSGLEVASVKMRDELRLRGVGRHIPRLGGVYGIEAVRGMVSGGKGEVKNYDQLAQLLRDKDYVVYKRKVKGV